MLSEREARELGMDRPITRRDFINGIAVGAAGIWASRSATSVWAEQPPFAPERATAYYPPALTGLRGTHVGAFEAGHNLRAGAYQQVPRLDVDTGELYDLVIVGGGISGLAAAYFFRQALGSERTVLILDNHDDFGGHAKRNEFTYQGRTFIGYGGTQSISTPFPYSYVAKALIADLGIHMERAREFVTNTPTQGLKGAMFFDQETFGENRLVVGVGEPSWEKFFEKTPFSEQARHDLIRIHATKKDYLPGLSAAEKAARLAKMSYQDYLVNVAGVTPEAIKFFLGEGGRNNKRIDTMPALEAARSGDPGFNGLGLEFPPDLRGGDSYRFHFPDGNASAARLLVKKLVPDALPGAQEMETVVVTRLNYARLDEPGSNVRIRLNSTAVRVQHDGDPRRAASVRVAYVRGGRLHGVRARNVVLACWNMVIPYLMPELPPLQKEALAYPVKVPLIYTNVFIRNWRAFHKLGVARVSFPTMYFTSCSLDTPPAMGAYQGSASPDEPIILHMTRNPNNPGLPRKDQQRAGQREIMETPFEKYELEIRRQLSRALGSAGFEPAEDILAITVNRWPHGYAYTYDTLADPDVPDAERPHVIGRKPFGKVTIANCDAGAAAYTNVAIDEAHRAVQELLLANGLK